jgi:hypothetical protein
MPPTRRRRQDSPSSDEDSEEDSDAEGCTNNSSIDEGEDSSSATSTDTQLSTEARLAAAGLYHLQPMHLILCTTCKLALGPRHAASHANREHSRNTAGLQEVLNTLDLCKPSEAELVALPASTPHLLRASSQQRSTVPAFIISRRPIRLAPIDELAAAPASSSSSGDSYHQQRYLELQAHANASIGSSESTLWSKVLACTHWHKRLGVENVAGQAEENGEETQASVLARLKALYALLAKPEKPRAGLQAGRDCSAAWQEYSSYVLIQDAVTQAFTALLDVVKDRADQISMALQHDELAPSTHANNAQEPLFISSGTLRRYTGLWASMICVLLKTYTHFQARISGDDEEGAAEGNPLLADNSEQFPYKEVDMELCLEGIGTQISIISRTRNQRGVTEEEASPPVPLDRLMDLILRLSISLVEWPVNSSQPSETGFLLTFASMLGIHCHSSTDFEDVVRFCTETEYNPKSSALIWCARALALAPACPFFTGRNELDAPNASFKHDIDALKTHVEHWRQHNLLKTCPRPVPHLVQWRRWCQAVSEASLGTNRMDIRDDKIRFLGMDFALSDIRTFASACIEEADRALDNIFTLDGAFQQQLRPHVPPVKLLHKESFEGNGYGLTHKSVQDRLIGYPNLRTCVQHGEPGPIFTATVPDADPDGDEFNDAVSEHLLQLEGTFLEHLLVAVHCLGGNAARGTELLSATVVDGVDRPRSVYTGVDDIIYLVLPHSKTARTDRPGKLLARFLPPRLSYILLRYLLLARPHLDACHLRINQDVSRHLFRTAHGRTLTPSSMTDILRRETDRLGLGMGLSISQWRQLASGLIKMWAQTKQEALVSDEVEEEEEQEGNLHEQANHSASTAASWYALTVDDLRALSTDSILRSQEASRSWHRLLQLEVATVQPGSRQPVGLVHPTMNSCTIAMAQLTGQAESSVTFKTQSQRSALVQLIAYPRHNHLLILETGAGKSMLWAAPALASSTGSVTVLILPYRILRSQAEAFQSKGLSVGTYSTRRSKRLTEAGEDPKIVLVATEHLLHHRVHLLTAIKQLQSKKMLLRIVCEEIHTIITDSNYRECMAQVSSIFKELPSIPIIGLTGSLTEELEAKIIHNVLNANGNEVKTLRTATMRSNIKLHKQAFDYSPEGLDEMHIRCAQLIEQQSRVGSGRTLVICRLRDYVADVKAKLVEMGIRAEVCIGAALLQTVI